MTELYLPYAERKIIYGEALFVLCNDSLCIYPLEHLRKRPIKKSTDPRIYDGDQRGWDYCIYGADASAWDSPSFDFGPDYVKISTKTSVHTLTIPKDVDFNKPDWIKEYRTAWSKQDIF